MIERIGLEKLEHFEQFQGARLGLCPPSISISCEVGRCQIRVSLDYDGLVL